MTRRERRQLEGEVLTMWRLRPSLAGNYSLTARRIVRAMNLDPRRERSLRRLAAKMANRGRGEQYLGSRGAACVSGEGL